MVLQESCSGGVFLLRQRQKVSAEYSGHPKKRTVDTVWLWVAASEGRVRFSSASTDTPALTILVDTTYKARRSISHTTGIKIWSSLSQRQLPHWTNLDCRRSIQRLNHQLRVAKLQLMRSSRKNRMPQQSLRRLHSARCTFPVDDSMTMIFQDVTTLLSVIRAKEDQTASLLSLPQACPCNCQCGAWSPAGPFVSW